MTLAKSRKKEFLSIMIIAFIILAIFVLQAIDDYIADWTARKMLMILIQYILFGLIAFWIASVISRVSDRSVRTGITIAIILMGMILFIRLLKYHLFYDVTSNRYLWYSYYIPQCLAAVVLLVTTLHLGKEKSKPLPKKVYLLFIPAILFILLVFTNDLHEQVFSFAKGLKYSNEIYKWEWGYYLILFWIASLYLSIGIILYCKCRISQCRKKAWIPLVLLISCFILCIIREIFDPSFIRMPEMVVLCVVIVFESLIRIGFIPSNVNYQELFYMADIKASIADKDLNMVLSSKKTPKITKEQAFLAIDNKIGLSEDIYLRGKAIRGGEVFWIEDYAVINKINESLAEINARLAEESDLITAENKLKEQQSKIEEQNNLYKEIFAVFKPHLEKINECFSKARSQQEKEKALKLAVVYGVYLKRRSNLTILAKNQQTYFSELLYAIRESTDALSFYGAPSSVILEGDGIVPIEQIILMYEFFEECIELALPNLSACLVRLENKKGLLYCRIALDNVSKQIESNWRYKECEKLNGTVHIQKEDETLYTTILFSQKEERI